MQHVFWDKKSCLPIKLEKTLSPLALHLHFKEPRIHINQRAFYIISQRTFPWYYHSVSWLPLLVYPVHSRVPVLRVSERLTPIDFHLLNTHVNIQLSGVGRVRQWACPGMSEVIVTGVWVEKAGLVILHK